jgi:nucleoid DNA-binding protein
MTTTKREIANDVVKKTGCNKRLSLKVVGAVFESLYENIIQGNHIEIRGFGSFNVKLTNPRPQARIPRTGEIVYVPSRHRVSFKPGKALRDVLKKPVGDKR